jgi:hypothetical protein
MSAVPGAIGKIVFELNQQMSQFTFPQQRLKTFMKLLYNGRIDFALVCEIAVQLGGKEKLRFCSGPSQPRFAVVLGGRPIERAVDLQAIHKPAYIFELVNSRTRIDNPFPVRIRPPCYANID